VVAADDVIVDWLVVAVGCGGAACASADGMTTAPTTITAPHNAALMLTTQESTLIGPASGAPQGRPNLARATSGQCPIRHAMTASKAASLEAPESLRKAAGHSTTQPGTSRPKLTWRYRAYRPAHRQSAGHGSAPQPRDRAESPQAASTSRSCPSRSTRSRPLSRWKPPRALRGARAVVARRDKAGPRHLFDCDCLHTITAA